MGSGLSQIAHSVVRSREETEAKFRSACPVFFEILPLTLEEVFISETEVAGYDVKKFILD